MAFELPDSLKGITADKLHQEILEKLPDDIDKTEGGFAWDFTRPAANIAAELVNYYIPKIMMNMFPQWAEGIYLDYLASVMHIYRKESAKATTYVTVTGSPGTIIPFGSIFSTESTNETHGYKFITTERALIEGNGEASVPVEAEYGGTAYNVMAGSICLCTSNLAGISGVSNPQAASGGADKEDDEALRSRLMSFNAERDISYVGNNADYRRWALEVPGVGNAYVTPEYDGPGTVGITIIDDSGEIPSDALMQTVYEHIMEPDNPYERLAPPDVILYILPAKSLLVDYEASLTIGAGYDLETIEESFEALLDAYYDEAFEEGILRIHRVGAILSLIEGVVDYSGLTLNEAEENIVLEPVTRPRTGTVSFNLGGGA